MMKKEDSNRLVIDRFVEFINSGDRSIGENIISPDVIFHAPTSEQPLRGIDGYMAVLDMMRGAMPATGKAVRVTAMNIYQLHDGMIVREHGLPDLFSMLVQLGMMKGM